MMKDKYDELIQEKNHGKQKCDKADSIELCGKTAKGKQPKWVRKKSWYEQKK